MAVAIDTSAFRGWASHMAHATHVAPAQTLEEKYEVVKEIGDGSFGSVVLGRTRSAGAQIVRRNTMVAIKTMKKTFDSFSQCMELREVIFLKSLPAHPHLVPAYDIFLDPLSRKLHIAMEHMDGNLYQLMKSRDHKPFDGASVKSVLCQILAGLEHIHEHSFFHRDIKPENILVSTSSPDSGHSFKRYSALVTPPSTPPTYTIKLADFGLARETHSRTPYTTYVSTRWYRAPEVLLRAGEYSAPVDIWALGAMAVEIATLKPLFPGSNEVDQVWRVCEIMGSPGQWVNRHNQKLGGGDWKEGVRLAQKLGFSFPKMAPHSLESILPSPQWPPALAQFVTWCLMWDPKARPTSTQALAHEYFSDAVDPLRPRSSSTQRRLGHKKSGFLSSDSPETMPGLTTKTSSWFRRSLGPREPSTNTLPDVHTTPQPVAARPPVVHANTDDRIEVPKARAPHVKRTSWTHSQSQGQAQQPRHAPIPILPSIKPVSPLQDAVTAQGSSQKGPSSEKSSTKIGRQLSVNSHGNHYTDYHRQEAEKALTGSSGLASPTGSMKESFFSHLRKRARRFSGRNQTPVSPSADEEASAGCAPFVNNSARHSMSTEPEHLTHDPESPSKDSGFAELDKVLQNVRSNLESNASPSNSTLRRNPSLNRVNEGHQQTSPANSSAPITSRTRRSVRHGNRPGNQYETPDEEDELLDEALTTTTKAVRKLDYKTIATSTVRKQPSRPALNQVMSDPGKPLSNPYLTPSPSKENNAIHFGQSDNHYTHTPSKSLDIGPPVPRKDNVPPTPPYEENEWAAAAAASIFAAQAAVYR